MVGIRQGHQKINLHQLGNEFEPKAGNIHIQSGSADLCFIIKQPVKQAIDHLLSYKVSVIEGPIVRTGVKGKIISAYFREPDTKQRHLKPRTYYI